MAAAIAVCLAAFPAKAQTFYGGIRGGLAETQTMRFAQPSTANLAIDPHRAWVLSGTFGTHLSPRVRVEGSLSYQRGGIGGVFNENATPCGTAANQLCLDPGVRGSLKVPSLLAMAYYDTPLAPSLVFSVGAGVGAVWMNLDAHTTARSAAGSMSRFSLIKGTDTLVAGRAEANLIYGTGPLRFQLGYSYTRTSNVSLRGRGLHSNFNFNPRLDSHQIMAGFRFRF